MTPEPTDKPTIEPCYQEGCGERCDSFCRPQSFPKTGMSWTVECLSCGYNTGDMDTEEQATAAHNAIARKLAGAEGLRDALPSEHQLRIEPCYQEGCGGECEIDYYSADDCNYEAAVTCKECSYFLGYGVKEGQGTVETISAHNAIARKVADYPTVLAERDAFQLQNTQLRRELARAEGLRDVLKSVEWVYSYAERKCPVCFNVPAAGHTAGCKLFAALANAPDAGEGGDDDSR